MKRFLNINKILLILLISSLFLNFVKSQQTIADVSLLENYNFYADKNGTCNFELDFIVEDQTDVSITSVASSSGTLYQISKNSKSSKILYKLILTASTSSTQNKITINGQQNSQIDYPLITCNELPMTLDYDLISNLPNKVSDSEFNLNLIINNINKLIPSNSLIQTICPSYLLCQTSQIGSSNSFVTLISLNGNSANPILNTDFNITYNINNSNKTYLIKSPFMSLNNNNTFALNSYVESNGISKSISSFLKISGLNNLNNNNNILNNLFLKYSNNDIKSFIPIQSTSNDITILSKNNNLNLNTPNTIELMHFSTNNNTLSKINGEIIVAQQEFIDQIKQLKSNNVAGTYNQYSSNNVQMITVTSTSSNFYETMLNDTFIQFPLGFKTNNKVDKTFTKELSINVNSYTAGNKYLTFESTLIKNIQISSSSSQDDTTPPQIKLMALENIGKLSIVKFEIVDDLSGFLYLHLSNGIKMDSSYLTKGTLQQGQYELIFNLFDTSFQSELRVEKICDFALNCFEYSTNNNQYQYSVYNIDSSLSFPSLGKSNINLSNITSFSFKSQSIDTTNQNVYTSCYFNLSNINPSTDYPPFIEFESIDSISPIDYKFNQVFDKLIFQAYWNNDLSLYQIDFTIRKNQINVGDLKYWLNYHGQRLSNTLLQSKFDSSAKLSIISNSQIDTIGPIITSIQLVNNNTEIKITQDSPIQVGWKLQIQDHYNGFSNGYVSVVSLETGRSYNISLVPSIAGLVENEFYVTLPNTGNCVSQTLSINKIYLEDTGGYSSYQIIGGSESNQYSTISISPLVNIKSLPQAYVNCDKIDNTILPELKSLVFSSNGQSISSFDVGSINRNIKVTFEVSDNDGIDQSQLPYCYLETTSLSFLSIKSSVLSNVNYTNTQFLCDIELPIGFGYKDNILFSIYGVYDMMGNLNGFSSQWLRNNGFSSYYINATQFTLDTPAIYSVAKFTNQDSKITLIGRSLDNSIIQIDYLQGLGFENITSINSSNNNSSSILTSNINRIGYQFNIRIIKLSTPNQISNTINILPIIVGSIINNSNNNNTQCLSDCGGISNGICSSNGCQCNLPWTGLDCLSKIQLINNSTIKSTNNSPTTIISNNNNDQLNKEIDVVGLREVDSNGNIIIKSFTFTQWSLIVSQNTSSKYSTSIENNKYSTSINVSIVYNTINNATTIQYQVDIGSYSFSSNTSSLQLLFKNSLTKSSTFKGVSCSTINSAIDPTNINQFNNILQVNDDQLLNQVNLIASIDNTQSLIESVSSNSTNKGNTVGNIIIIEIPQYNVMASVNSKYSIIKVPSSLISSKSSVCVSLNIKKGGLSEQQKAAISVAFVGGFIIFCIFLWFFIIKPRRDARKGK